MKKKLILGAALVLLLGNALFAAYLSSQNKLLFQTNANYNEAPTSSQDDPGANTDTDRAASERIQETASGETFSEPSGSSSSGQENSGDSASKDMPSLFATGGPPPDPEPIPPPIVVSDPAAEQDTERIAQEDVS